MKKLVIAIGGNSIIKVQGRQTVEDQYMAICETAASVVDIIVQGYNVIITHGNGPQVGFIFRRSEIAYQVAGMHLVPLVNCVADTQGSIGYQIQQALNNEFASRGIDKKAVTIVTQVEVDGDDPAFSNPTKPIGTFYTEEEAARLQLEYPDWQMINDAGRGYRRAVSSPLPRKIVELDAIEKLAACGYCIVAAGGGGIPVIRNRQGCLEGIDAVVDKDYASSLLASLLQVDLFVISTGVDKVYLNYGKLNQQALDRATLSQLKEYMEAGHFAAGSMLPKIKAAISFLEKGGKKVIITSPDYLGQAVRGESGTHLLAG